jgi:hypothetical protein
MEAAAQVTVRFVTKLPAQYRVPGDPVVRGVEGNGGGGGMRRRKTD